MSTESAARKAAEQKILCGNCNQNVFITTYDPELGVVLKCIRCQEQKFIDLSAACQTVVPPRLPPVEFIEQWADKELGEGNRPCGWPHFGSVSYQQVCKMLESYAGSAPAVSTPPLVSFKRDPDNGAGLHAVFVGDMPVHHFNHDKPIKVQQYMNRLRAEISKSNPTAVSTPRCPKCHAPWNKRPDDFREWIHDGVYQIYCATCGETYSLLHVTEFLQFFHPAPEPPAPAGTQHCSECGKEIPWECTWHKRLIEDRWNFYCDKHKHLAVASPQGESK